MDLRFVSLDDRYQESWDSFVAANPHAWPGHDRAIIDFERSRGHESFAHLILGDEGQVVAVAPLFLLRQRRARLFQVRTLSTGSTLRGGPLLRADSSPRQRQTVMETWATWITALARRERVDEIRVAFPHVMGDRLSREVFDYYPLSDYGFLERAHLTMLMDLSAPGDLFGRLAPACRKAVRRATKAGAEVEAVTDRETWMGFNELNHEFSRSKGFAPLSEESMAILWDRFVARGLAHAFCIRSSRQAICAMIVVGTRHSCYAWIGFNRIPRPVIGASNLLMYNIMEWLRATGRRYFELGSVEFDTPDARRITAFKRSFGGQPQYGLDGGRIVNEMKVASIDWLQALAGRWRDRTRSGEQWVVSGDVDADSTSGNGAAVRRK